MNSMKKTHRIAWSKDQNTFVAVTEFSRAPARYSTRQRISQAVAATILTLGAGHAMAAGPTDTCPSDTTTISTNTSGKCVLDNGQSLVVNPGVTLNGAGQPVGVAVPVGTIAGDITNNGTIINATTPTVIGIDGTLTGDLTNNGTIGTSGAPQTPILVTGKIQGDLINNGTIFGGAVAVNNGTINSIVNGASGIISTSQTGLRLTTSSTISSGITNSGTITSGGRGIFIESNASVNGIVNEGTIQASSAAIKVTVGTVSGAIINAGLMTGSTGINLRSATLSSGITNSGTIASDSEWGIVSENTTITGDIANTETGIISSTYGEVIFLRSNVIDGSIFNAGTLDQQGSGGYGVVYVEDTSITGNISNSGTIINHDQVYGLHLANSTVVGGITNSGYVSGQVFGVMVTNLSRVGGIVNSGTISGENYNGLTIKSRSVITGGINNTGLIQGSSNGVSITDATAIRGGLTNSGTISGGSYSIFSSLTALTDINIAGTTSRLDGDVYAPYTDVHVLSDAEFGITDDFEVQSFQNAGTLYVAPSLTPTITSDYTQTGTLQIGVSSGSSYGQIAVTGTATLPDNAAIDVNVVGIPSLTPGAVMADILTAGSLTSDGTYNVTATSILYSFSAVKDGNTVDLVFDERKTITEVLEGAGYGSVLGAAKTFDDVLTNGSSSTGINTALDTIVHQGTAQDLAYTLGQTLPLLAGAGRQIVGGMVAGGNQVVEARQDANKGIPSGDSFLGDRYLWGKVYGSWADQGDRSGTTGFNARSQGLILGGDGSQESDLRFGVAFNYSRSAISSNDVLQHAKVDNYQVIGYGSYSLDEQTDINVQADLGLQSIDAERRMPSFSRTAKADYNGQSGHIGVGVARTYPVSEKTSLSPVAHVDYTLIRTDGYTETGANALNLKVDAETSNAFVIGTGARLTHALTDNTSLRANVDVGYDVINDQAQATSSFVGGGAAFTTKGISPSPWVGRVGLDLTTMTDGGTEFVLGYDLEGRNDYTNQTASAKIRLPF